MSVPTPNNTGATYTPPVHFVDQRGREYCAHVIRVAPGSCPECHNLTDEHWDSGCTCRAEGEQS